MLLLQSGIIIFEIFLTGVEFAICTVFACSYNGGPIYRWAQFRAAEGLCGG